MTKVKEASSIQSNKKTVFELCPVTYVMEKIGGYWKPIILFHLLSGSKRYHELKKAMPHITEKVLIQHLKQLEEDKLLVREALPVVPPQVTYRLSESGWALRPVLYAMANWAIEEGRRSEKPLFLSLDDFPKLV
jgi:DNA-binding HxlR family transcriptional regulator